MASLHDNEEPNPEFAPGTRVGAYRLEAFVAAGGMAEVYRARHLKLDKVVAIKFLDRKHAARPVVVARFLREGKFASQVRHPNVVEVADVDEHDGLPYLVMEYLEGKPLSEVISDEGALEPDAIARIMLPVCAAVAAAHAKGVIHRDLKPGNIFLAETDVGEVQPKVLDFGISKSVEEDPASALTTSASFLGTPIYLSPEQASGEDGTTASDQYSLGVILYELATGTRPYDTGQKFIRLLNSIATGDFDPPRVHHETLSEDLEAVIMRAMSLQPHDRFPSLVELATTLLRVADDRTRTLWQPRLAKLGDGTMPTLSKLPRDKSDAVTELATATTVTRAGDRPATPAPNRSRRRALYLGASLALAVLVWQAIPDGSQKTPAEPADAPPAASTYAVAVEAEPASAELWLDGASAATGHLDIRLPLDGRAHQLEIRAAGHVTQRFSFRDAPPPSHVRLELTDEAPAPTSSATVEASAEPVPDPPKKPRLAPPKPNAAPTPATTPTYSAHPDNIDPWGE